MFLRCKSGECNKLQEFVLLEMYINLLSIPLNFSRFTLYVFTTYLSNVSFIYLSFIYFALFLHARRVPLVARDGVPGGFRQEETTAPPTTK